MKKKAGCCDTGSVTAPKRRRVAAGSTLSKPAGDDHRRELNRLSRIIGQLEGVRRMIEERRYCPEILIQTRAASSAIRSLEGAILEGHLRHCMVTALASASASERATKVDELVDLFERR